MANNDVYRFFRAKITNSEGTDRTSTPLKQEAPGGLPGASLNLSSALLWQRRKRWIKTLS